MNVVHRSGRWGGDLPFVQCGYQYSGLLLWFLSENFIAFASVASFLRRERKCYFLFGDWPSGTFLRTLQCPPRVDFRRPSFPFFSLLNTFSRNALSPEFGGGMSLVLNRDEGRLG
ncbi:hypothetical protein CDAR_573511 [Caerostris darwini]|uniref:Uncharacterized protein n=1 Tax=Caerostris darwini TaxID=1538125 RepID=A0AAV4T9U6_9ARAC|nr:hypothetical protein CDAR_573511 [Caerostris darwini]